jgi:hypothetical protein
MKRMPQKGLVDRRPPGQDVYPELNRCTQRSLSDETGSMAFVTGPKDGGESGEKELVARLRKFVEDSDLSFYKIALRI